MEKTINIETKKYDPADDAEYLFTCAELKAKEYEFLDNSKIERLAAAKTTEDFLKILSETIYSKKITLIDANNDLDVFILQSYREITDFLIKRLAVKDRPLIYLLFLEEFVHDFKTGLKALVLNTSLEKLFIPLTFSYTELTDFLKKDEYSPDAESMDLFDNVLAELAKQKKKLLNLAESDKEKKISFKNAEIMFEKKFISLLLEEIKKTGSLMLTDFLRHWIDIQNLKNMNRIKYSGKDIKNTDYFYPGGMIDSGSFNALAPESTDYWSRAFEKSAYGEIAIKGIHSLFSYNTFFSFDKNETLFSLKFFDQIKYSVCNIEKIFAFFLRKKTELIVLNMIYMGIKYHAQKRNIEHKAEFLSES